jgi:anti-sigma factor RsiW
VSREVGECAQCSRWSAPANIRRVHTRSHTARAPTVGTPTVGSPSAGVPSVILGQAQEADENQSIIDEFSGNEDRWLDPWMWQRYVRSKVKIDASVRYYSGSYRRNHDHDRYP